jgi:hypothetical protein
MRGSSHLPKGGLPGEEDAYRNLTQSLPILITGLWAAEDIE